MNLLPPELKLEILLQEDLANIFHLCRVNKDFNDICNTDIFWKLLYQREQVPLNLYTTSNNWRNRFIYAYNRDNIYDIYDQITDIKLNDPLLFNEIIKIQQWFNNHNYYRVGRWNKIKYHTDNYILISRPILFNKTDSPYEHGWIGPFHKGDRGKAKFGFVKNDLHKVSYKIHTTDQDKKLTPTNNIITNFYTKVTSILFTLEEFLKLDFENIYYRSSINITPDLNNEILKIINIIHSTNYLNNTEGNKERKFFKLLNKITTITRLKLLIIEMYKNKL